MTARSDAVAETRAAIVAAATQLHTEQGVVSTSWEDIASASGVSVATVYRHFPSLRDLVPACAQVVFDIIRPPTPDEAAVQFESMPAAEDRFEHLARESCHCYRRGEGWLHAAHRERDFVPELDAALSLIQDTLHVLVRAAAEGRRLDRRSGAVLFTLCDFPFWKQLVDQGTSYRVAEEIVVGLVRDTAVGLETRHREKVT